MSASEYLEVLKASYDYEPQSEDELAIKEDQILLLLERVDDEWWKVKVKESVDESEGGLVPAAYVEPVGHTSVVKALYDYDATAPGELSVKEDQELLVYDKDDDWLLVKSEQDGKVGYVPGNYVEEFTGQTEGEVQAPSHLAASQIVIPPSPPRSPRPVSKYVDPADLVASTKAQADNIQTWAVSEVDKKGKKKKGTLGVGNGAVFFASESDKTPVQKWQTSSIESTRIDKSKHVHIEVGGSTPTSLHFNAGSKDTADAIIAKLESSAKMHAPSPTPTPAETSAPKEVEEKGEEPKPKKNGVSVHFSSSPNAIIPPREPSDDGNPEESYEQVELEPESASGGESATVLYDFAADGDDELTVHEGENLVVLDKDSDEWWKCRNANGHEGVVPASYVELTHVPHSTQNGVAHYPDTDAGADAEEEDDGVAAREAEEAERIEAERLERERMEAERAEAKRRAKAAAEAAEADRVRREREAEERADAETRRRMELESEQRRKATREPRPGSASGSRPRPSQDRPGSAPPRDSGSSKGRTSTDKGSRGPAPKRTRVWHDRTGQFQVEAEFLGFSNGKLRLHKINGVVIEVPMEKMSQEDMDFLERVKRKKAAASAAQSAANPSDDEEPLDKRRQSLLADAKAPSARVPPVKKGPSIDWFEFFLSAGCDIDDCTRYGTSFERDKIDESILPDITDQTMRSLGLREGDIIRVKKAIAQRIGNPPAKVDDSAQKELLRKDEELARQLQAEESGRTTPKAPNLFAGPGGVLKNNTQRRGRPQPSKSTPPISVDLNSITNASEQITGGSIGSPSRVVDASPVQAPLRSSSAAPVVNGFDDDAWTNRPSSTKPLAPTPPAVALRAPSAPPAPPPPPAPQAPAPEVPQVAQPQTQSKTSSGLARTTESDVFDQLARLSQLRTQSPAVSPAVSANSTASPSISSAPASFQHGLGMGSSPVPLGQHLRNQQTGFQPQPPQQTGFQPQQVQQTGFQPQQSGFQPQLSGFQPQQPVNAPRGPFAPVPANQSLLQPLVPTTTGFNNFVPTRPGSNPSPFQPQPQRSFLSSQSTGFPGPMRPQSTGFPGSNPMMPQQTGAFSPFSGGVPFNGNGQFGQVQPQPTGINSFNPNAGFNPMFNNMASAPPVPPIPPLPNSPPTNNSPANIFAQMKSGTFGADDAPQPSDKYDALRPQATGWGYQGPTSYQNGFTGYQR